MELSACSCRRLIEIYDQVHVPLSFQYKLRKMDLLYVKIVSVDFSLITFSLTISDILYFLTLTSTSTCVCVSPSFHLLSPLPTVILHSPRLIQHALIILVNFHESCYLCCVCLRGTVEQLAVSFLLGGPSVGLLLNAVASYACV